MRKTTMPKNKKPAGGRPARNFEPRRGAKTSYIDRQRGRGGRPGSSEGSDASPQRGGAHGQGSRSPKHRGYRPEAEEAPKKRWTAQEKAGRDEARGIRTHSRNVDGARPRTDARTAGERKPWEARRGDTADRRGGAERGGYDRRGRAGETYGAGAGDRRSARDDRGYGRDDRGYGRDDRGENRGSGAWRGARDERGHGRDDRGYGRDDRRGGARAEGRDRPERGYGNDRPGRGYGNDRPGRGYGSDRPERGYGSDDRRGARDDRGYGRGDAPRTDRRDRSESAGGYGSRPERRAAGGRGRDERRPYDETRRPARTWEDRPRRDDRARGSDGPQRTAQHDARVDVVHERLQAESVAATDVEGMTFGDLGLGDNISRALADLGATSPFAIQAATIPEVIAGRDVLARGRTGSGKTIAFGAPLVEAILRSRAGARREFGRAPSAIILAPTRELALPIDRTEQPIARSVGLFTTQIYGGVPQGRQVGALKKGVDIIIGTPGRIEDLIEQGKLDLSQVRVAVLDEADHMCELGFLEPVQRILRHTADGSQKLLFSATLDREVAALVDEFLVNPAVYEVADETQETGTIEHRVLVIDHRDKSEILRRLVDRDGKTLVFSRTRAYAEQLADEFDDAGIPAVSLHGDLNQAKRTRNLHRLTSGRVAVLVATDVAARGIHVDDIDLVIQADAPDEYKTYLHRSGRTGRAGASGRVVTLITRQRRRRMTELLDRAEIDAPFDDVRVGDDLIDEIAGAPTIDDLTS